MYKYNDRFEHKIWNGTRALSAALCIFILCVMVGAGTAWSYDRETHIQNSGVPSDIKAQCRPFLEPGAQMISPAPDNIVDHREIGAAAIGLVFGVRYATGPMEQAQEHSDSTHAALVQNYRRCISHQLINNKARKAQANL